MPAVAVALTPASLSVPAVFEHDVPDINVTGLPHGSFAGWANEAKGNNKKINTLFVIFRMVRDMTKRVITGFSWFFGLVD
jgi:hypothetical protein